MQVTQEHYDAAQKWFKGLTAKASGIIETAIIKALWDEYNAHFTPPPTQEK